MAIQKKLKSFPVAVSRKTRKNNNPGRKQKGNGASQEAYHDFLRSLETLKVLFISERENVGNKTMFPAGAFDRTIDFLDSLIETSKNGMFQKTSDLKIIKTPSLSILTRREQEVLKLVASGLANKNIANKLKISIRTVEAHRSHLTKKLDIKTTAGLVKYAISQELT